MKTLKNKKGFTLIELIVVIAILGVLALILVPQFMGYVDDADIQTQRSNVESIERATTASLAKIRTLSNKSDRTYNRLRDMIKESLGESFSEYKILLSDGPSVNIEITDSIGGGGVVNSSVRVESITFNGCVYTVSTNTYSGTCGDVTNS